MNRRPALPFLAAILAGAHLLSPHVLSQDGSMNVIAWRGEQPARAAHGMVVSAPNHDWLLCWERKKHRTGYEM
jgi:hypothetical protein